MRTVAIAIVGIVGILLVGPRVAAADDKPWAAGVSADQQAAALALYREGNAFFEQSQFAPALARYKRALEAWDHPAIRYNAAVCLINLDRPIEADEHLRAAMRFGAAPLGPELYQQGKSYEKLLAPRIAELEVVCEEPGAEVSLNGEKLFDAPGTARRRVLAASPHQLVARKDRYETVTRSVTLAAGETTTLVLELRLLESAKQVTRRWRTWKPWAVVVGGAAVGLAGVGLYATASGGFDAYDRRVDAECPQDCDPERDAATLRSLAGDKSSAERAQVLAFSGFFIGGAVLATGAMMVYLNQPRVVGAPAIVPSVGPDHAGVAVFGRW